MCSKGKISVICGKTIDIKLREKASIPAKSILSAMVWFSKAWMALPDKNFTNCFCKCRMSVETAVSAIADDDDLLTGLVEDEKDMVKTSATDLNFLRINYSNQVDTDLAMDEYIDFDRELPTNQSILTDKDIIHEVLGNSVDVNSDEDDLEVSKEEFIKRLLIEEVRTAIKMLEELSFYSEFRKGIMKSVTEVNHYVDTSEQKTRKQSNIAELLRKLIDKIEKVVFL